MIQTIYSNSFEVLQTAFLTYVEYDLNDKYKCDDSSIFEPIKVISPSEAISDQLKRSLADKLSICAGIDFSIVQRWLGRYTTKTLYQTVSSLDWLVWEVLKEKKLYPSKDKRYEPLNHYLMSLDEIGLIEFARHLSSLFVTYGTYRFDWLIEWSGQKLDTNLQNAATLKERMELRKDPNFGWQSELWKEIVEADLAKKESAKDTIVMWLDQMAGTFEHIDLSKDSNKPVHLFMPFALPPVLLPLIKAFSPEKAPLLYLYILNPCSEYWFDALPKKLFDWKLDRPSTASSALTYLWTNAASTRAMIDRLFNFISDVNSVFENQEDDQYTKYQNSERETRRRIFKNDPSQYKPEIVEISSAYIYKGSGTFLNRFQDSILKLDNSLLPTEPDPKDESLRILQAPSFTRELEAFVDILHHWISSNPERQIKASDILVVVPDIQKAVPYIEGVMRELPDNMSFPWKIIGLPLVEQNRMAQACICMLGLLQSNFTIDELFNWLELPSVQSVFALSLNDITVLRKWLNLAGFRFGINSDQLKTEGFDDEDCSLDLALERLTLGFFMKHERPEIFDQTLALDGSEDRGFDHVTDESGRLLMTITKIFELFNGIKKDLKENHDSFTADVWCSKLSEWFQDISNADKSPEDTTAFNTVFKNFVSSIREAFSNNNEPIELSVIANEFSKELTSSIEPVRLSDAITFAPIQLTRGLPFKIIAALGFDEDSGFPGKSKFEEFNLMKDFPRRGDRDARRDNNAIFLDTMLSARENLIISYTVGTKPQADNNPSVVIENFKNYFLSHAREQDREDTDNKDSANLLRAEVLWKSLISRVPLNKFSVKNFDKANLSKDIPVMEPRFNPFWVSQRADVKESIDLAVDESYSASPAHFADMGIPDGSLPSLLTKAKTLPLSQLIYFITKPEKWALKAHKLHSYQKEENENNLVVAEDHLHKATRYRKLLDLLKQGFSKEDILEIEKLYPINGLKTLRESGVEGYINKTSERFREMQQYIEDHFDPNPKTVVFRSNKNLETSNKIEFISDESDKVYYTKDNKTPYWINICSSNSDRNRKLLRQFFWVALGQPISQILFSLADKEEQEKQGKKEKNQREVAPSYQEIKYEDIDTNAAISLLKISLKLLELQINTSLGLTENQKDPPSFLWRGNDKFEEIRSYSKAFNKSLSEFLSFKGDMADLEINANNIIIELTGKQS